MTSPDSRCFVLACHSSFKAVHSSPAAFVQLPCLFVGSYGNMSGPSSSPEALTSKWANAPTNVLESILQHVEVPERLKVCALVCTSWLKAAQGATSSIHYDKANGARLTAKCSIRR